MSVPSIYQRNLKDFAFGSARRVVASDYTVIGATAYTSGDLMANSATAGSVVPITFASALRTIGTGGSAKVRGVKCVVSPPSGNIVVTNLDFDLLLFRPVTGIPFTAGAYPADNAALSGLTAAKFKELLCVVPFVNGAWRNPLGALTASTAGVQFALPTTIQPAVLDLSDFDTTNALGDDVLAIMQAKAAWDPSAAAHTFSFTLYLEQD